MLILSVDVAVAAIIIAIVQLIFKFLIGYQNLKNHQKYFIIYINKQYILFFF